MRQLALLIIFLLQWLAAEFPPQFVKQVKTFFIEERYEEGLSYLKGLESHEGYWGGQDFSLSVDRYMSIFYSYRTKQLFEKKEIFKAIRLTSKVSRFNKALLEKYPSSPVALVGMGEDLQYKPALLGGDLQKAEEYFLQSLNSNATTYAAYKTLVFYLNAQSNMKKAKMIIERIQNKEFKKEPILEDFFQARVIYQEGVRWYFWGEYEKAREKLNISIKLQRDNYWSYYALALVEKELGLVYDKNWQQARLLGEKWDNKVFLARMDKEESRQ